MAQSFIKKILTLLQHSWEFSRHFQTFPPLGFTSEILFYSHTVINFSYLYVFMALNIKTLYAHQTSHFIFFFHVTVPRVEIVDERGLSTPDKFYKSGSTIELKCVISKVPQPTSYVTWKHGLRTLNYDTSRGGIR